MGLFSYLKEIFDPPKGPVYTSGELEHNYREYLEHVERTRTLLEEVQASHSLLCRMNGEYAGLWMKMTRVRFLWKWNLMGWMDDEFLPQIRKAPFVLKTGSDMRRFKVREDKGSELRAAVDHFDAVKHHSNVLREALTFFVSDERSGCKFSKGSGCYELKGLELAMWVVAGRDSVFHNMSRIEETLSTYIAFAKRYVREGA